MSTSSNPAPDIPDLDAFLLKEVITPEALARHVELPTQTILRELEAGYLTGRHVAGSWLIHRDAVRAWLCADKGGDQ